MRNPKQPSVRKRMNLTIPADLIQSAKDFGLNISEAAEDGIAAAVKKRREEAWLIENKAGLEAYDRMIEEEGLPIPPTWLLNAQEFEDRHGTV